MTSRFSATAVKRTGQGLAVLGGLLALATVAVVLRYGLPPHAEAGLLYAEAVGFVSSIVYPVIAILIIVRQPRHVVGWLLLIIGLCSALGSLAASVRALPGDILVRPIFVLLLWSDSWTWVGTFFILVSLVVLYFPDGRLPSRRWWPVLVASLIGIAGFMAHDAFEPTPILVGLGRELANPLGINASEGFFAALLTVTNFFLALGIIGSLLAMVIRFRRSRGIERTQMKWIVYVVGVCMSVVFLLSLLLGGDNPTLGIIFLSLPILIALTIGIAILRHRLFDIDIVIRRTVQYSIVSAILLTIYFGSIAVIQQMVTGVTQTESPLAIVISTLLIAALFNPLRQRVQAFVDRRFFRRRYDPQHVLAEFAEAARDETDSEVLKTELEQIVQKTLQPETVSVWLKR